MSYVALACNVINHIVSDFTFLVVPTIIIAHEFYDALPVHQFQVCQKIILHQITDQTYMLTDSTFRNIRISTHTKLELYETATLSLSYLP